MDRYQFVVVDDGDDEILRKGWGDVKCLADELRA